MDEEAEAIEEFEVQEATKKKSKKRMKVSGKSVFKLRDTIKKKAAEQGGTTDGDADTTMDAQ